MPLSGDSDQMEAQLAAIVEGYRQFCDFNPAGLPLIEALRDLGAAPRRLADRRWEDPAFPLTFWWLDSPRYWIDLVLGLREQLEGCRKGRWGYPEADVGNFTRLGRPG